MTDILSIVAVAGPFVGAGIGYIANGFLYRASLDYLRAERDEKEGEICSLKLKLISRNAQIVSLTSQLEAAGKPDQQAVSDRMREIGIKGNKSPKRKNRWIDWSGGLCPIAPGTPVAVKFRGGQIVDDCDAGDWDWSHHSIPGASNIIAYRVLPKAANDGQDAAA